MSLEFTIVDLVVLLTLLVSAGYAAYRGFVSESLSVVAWATAAFAMLYFAPSLAPFLRARISPPMAGTLAAYVGVFVVVLVPLWLVSHRFAQNVRSSDVSGLDRALGFVFGVVRGLAIIGFVYLLFSMVLSVKEQPRWIRGAHTLPLIQASSDALLAVVPSQKSAMTVAPAASVRTKTAVAISQKAVAQQKASGVKHRHHGYRTEDQRALDHLIETTQSTKP
jgi:membrane protein required for colicin V production